MKHRGLKFLSLLLTLVMVLGLMPGMSLTAYAASAVNVKIVTTLNSESRTIAESTTLPQDYTVAALIPTMGWDQNSYDIQVNGTNAQIKSGSGKDMVITISDKGTFTIEVKYDYYGMMTITKNATVSVTELELVPVTGVFIDPGSFQTLTVGESVTVKAEVYPDNATNKNVIWSVNGTGVTLYADQACTTPVSSPTSLLTVYAKATEVGGGAVIVNSSQEGITPATFNFEVKAATYTVTFKPGAGSGQDQQLTATAGADFELPTAETWFTAPEGQVFVGWKDDATDTVYKPGDKIQGVDKDYTFTAQWKESSSGGEKKTGGSGSGFDLVFNIPGEDNSWDYGGGYAPQQAYRVSLAPMQGGSAALGLTTGDSGTQMNVYPSTTVYVFPNAEQGYTLDKIVWSLIDGSASYDITEAKNFVMPAMDVVVYVTFRPVG